MFHEVLVFYVYKWACFSHLLHELQRAMPRLSIPFPFRFCLSSSHFLAVPSLPSSCLEMLLTFAFWVFFWTTLSRTFYRVCCSYPPYIVPFFFLSRTLTYSHIVILVCFLLSISFLLFKFTPQTRFFTLIFISHSSVLYAQSVSLPLPPPSLPSLLTRLNSIITSLLPQLFPLLPRHSFIVPSHHLHPAPFISPFDHLYHSSLHPLSLYLYLLELLLP